MESELTYIMINESKYHLFRDQEFYIGEIVILDKKDILFNPYSFSFTLDLTELELSGIIEIMGKIKESI